MNIPNEVIVALQGKSLEECIVRVSYTNWRDEEGVRKIIPLQIYFGNTEFHPDNQWLLKVWDCDKTDCRTFALKNIKKWIWK